MATKLTPKDVQKGKAAVEKAAAEAEAETKPSRNRGETTGKRIWEYQNETLVANIKAKETDETLAEMWRKEFPRAMEFGPKMVQTVRSLFNKGKHKNDVPPKPLVGYDEAGNVMAAPTRGRKKSEEVEEEVEAPAPKAVVKKVAKK